MSVQDQRGRNKNHVIAGPAPCDCCTSTNLTQHTLLKAGRGAPLRDVQKYRPMHFLLESEG